MNDHSDNIVSLKDLSEFCTKQPSNPFAIYQSLKGEVQRVELITLNTEKKPIIPIRRQSCPKCINSFQSCQKCLDCKGVTCCRGLQCFYELDPYQRNKDTDIYKKCKCKKQQLFEGAFSVDWRLLALLKKLPSSLKSPHRLFLHAAAGTLWITVEQQNKIDASVKVSTIYQDHFGQLSYHERQVKQSSSSTLAEWNSLNLTCLFRNNIQRFLARRQTWDVSNLGEECQDIADTFFSNKRLEIFKSNLQNTPIDNQYANLPSLRFNGKYTQTMFSSKQSTSSKTNDISFEGYSNLENEQLVFCYCPRSELIVVRNARFSPQDEEVSNIRPIRVQWDQKLGKDAVWFKDRKGDIFVVSKGALSIFKYNLALKCYKQFIISTHNLFNFVDNAAALLYVYQRDTVYFFNSKDLSKSFCFTLYRAKTQNIKEKGTLSKGSACGITNPHQFLAEKQKTLTKINEQCKVTYVMEDYLFTKNGKDRKELVPVIYLLMEKKNNMPVGVGLYQIVHHQENTIITEIPSLGQSADLPLQVNFKTGLFFPLRIDKTPLFCYYGMVDKRPTLLTGKVVSNDNRQKVIWKDDFLELKGCNEAKNQVERQLKLSGHMVCSQQGLESRDLRGFQQVFLVVSDLAGASGNNQFRVLGENIKNGSIVEATLSSVEGDLKWRIYDLT